MGGTDDSSNLVRLTLEEHAAAHKKLWEEHGKHEDFLAWQGLSNLLDKKQILKSLGKEKKGKIWVTNDIIHKLIHPNELEKYQKMGFRKGRLPMSEQGKANVKAASPKKRKPLTEEHKKNISRSLEGNINAGSGPRKKIYKTSWYSYEKYLQKRG